MNPITLFLAAAAGLAGIALFLLVSPWAGAPLVLMAVLITLSLKMANAWMRSFSGTSMMPARPPWRSRTIARRSTAWRRPRCAR
jgi:hypothetical protein